MEICNPLGSKRTIHKLGTCATGCITLYFCCPGFFYFTLGNLEPKFRSTIVSIQLLGIVKKSVMDMYGIDAVLQPFMDDIKKLVGKFMCQNSFFPFTILLGTWILYGC